MAISAHRHAGKPSLAILLAAIVLVFLILGATVWYFHDDSGSARPPALQNAK